MGRTLLDKIWDAHVVREEEGGRCVLYIDRQYIHEVTSPVAFAGIERRGLHIARPERITATADHNIPTDRSSRSRTPSRAGRSPLWRRTAHGTASNTSASAIRARGSSTSSAPSRALRSRA